MFTVPRISQTIAKRGLNERTITDEKIQQLPIKAAKDQFEIPSIILSSRRAGLLARLIERGKIAKSEYSFKELQQKKHFPDLMHSEVDCLDEADLRSRFPKQGTNHKFFISGSFKFEYLLPSDSEKVVVAQVLSCGKVRMPTDL